MAGSRYSCFGFGDLQEAHISKSDAALRPWTIASTSLISILAYLTAFSWILLQGCRLTHGRQFYMLDDTYIHAAIARHIVQDHTFGISPHIFSSASSSILWPLLLALCFKLFGIHIIFPLLLNAFFSVCILCGAAYFLWKLYPAIPRSFLLGLQLALLIITPLLTMTFVGMEHTLHIFLSLWFIFLAAVVISEFTAEAACCSPRSRSYINLLYVSAFLLVATRYEGAFTVIPAVFLLLLLKRIRESIFLSLSGMAPAVIFGVYSVLNGSHFLPNSLLLKTDAAKIPLLFHLQIFDMLRFRYTWIYAPSCLWILAIVLLFLSYRNAEFFSKKNVALFLFVVTFAFHLQFARLGWSWRYEAYLVAIAIFAFSICIADMYTTRKSLRAKTYVGFFILTGCCLIPFLRRIQMATLGILPSIRAIYVQQYQMAQFVKEYYPGAALVANDVGAISFYSNHDVIDIWGLGSIAVTNQRLAGRFTPASLNVLAHTAHAPLALVYRDWLFYFTGGDPGWIPVATWTLALRHPAPLGGDEVTFYAINPEDVAFLKQSLERYDSPLPKEEKYTLR